MDKEKKSYHIIKYTFIYLSMHTIFILVELMLAVSYNIFYTPKSQYFYPITYIFVITPVMIFYLLPNNTLKIFLFLSVFCYTILNNYDFHPLRTLSILISFSASIFSCHVLLYFFAIRENLKCETINLK